MLAHGILNGAPYTFLDDAPLEERRSRAVATRRGLGTLGADGLPAGRAATDPLDEAVVAEVVASAAPRVRSADELPELLVDLGRRAPGRRRGRRSPRTLVAEGRARAPTTTRGCAERQDAAAGDLVDDDGGRVDWCAATSSTPDR